MSFKYQNNIFHYWSPENFIGDVSGDERFRNLKSLNELSVKLIETGNSKTRDRVYLHLKLVLVLLVATASGKSIFWNSHVGSCLIFSICTLLIFSHYNFYYYIMKNIPIEPIAQQTLASPLSFSL